MANQVETTIYTHTLILIAVIKNEFYFGRKFEEEEYERIESV